jgi:CheY-like chemotaxis protein
MKKVMVVEDNPTNMELVVEMLTSCGFAVDTAVNGEDAVTKAENEVFDLIVMDIELPGMDGVDATKLIKSKPGYENTPAIALTAYAMKGDRERFLAEGFNEYISKPVNLDDFMKILKEYK